MSMEHPNILYFGSSDRAESLYHAAQQRDWCVYLPQSAHQALAMTVTYLPDIIVLDAASNPATAAEIYFHLRSIRVEPVIVLTHPQQFDRWHAEQSDGICLLDWRTNTEALLEVVVELVERDAAIRE